MHPLPGCPVTVLHGKADAVAALSDILSALESNTGAAFCVGGSFEPLPVAPGLLVKGKPLTEAAASLVKLMEVAPFGKGERTLIDPKVRDAHQIAASECAFVNPAFERALGLLVKLVAKELSVMRECVAVPYKLLLYAPGQHFDAPHKDSKKSTACLAHCWWNFHRLAWAVRSLFPTHHRLWRFSETIRRVHFFLALVLFLPTARISSLKSRLDIAWR